MTMPRRKGKNEGVAPDWNWVVAVGGTTVDVVVVVVDDVSSCAGRWRQLPTLERPLTPRV